MPVRKPCVPDDRRVTVAEAHAAISECNRQIWSRAIHWHRRNRSIDLEDLYQEIVAGWMFAATKYDLSRGIPFQAYAYIWGECYAKRLIAKHLQKGFRGVSGRERIFAKAIVVQSDFTREESMADDRVGSGEVWNLVRRRLNDKDWDVINKAFGEGMSYQQIADIRGVTRQHIHQTVVRVLSILKKHRFIIESNA